MFTDVSPARIDALAEVRDDLGDLDTATEEVGDRFRTTVPTMDARSEEHTSELQSP